MSSLSVCVCECLFCINSNIETYEINMDVMILLQTCTTYYIVQYVLIDVLERILVICWRTIQYLILIVFILWAYVLS